MKIFIVEDDPAVANILRMIVEQNGLGEVCGTARNGQDALDELADTGADMVLVDLLMPVMDGIRFVQLARAAHPEICFIMISHVTSKEMVADAYESGVAFFIHKPINSIEVLNVVGRVQRMLQLEQTFSRMKSLLGPQTAVLGSTLPPPPVPANTAAGQKQESLEAVLLRLGISGDPVSREIKQIAAYISALDPGGCEPTVAQLCAKFSDSPKALEQRIRRAVTAGLVNLAHMGLEDYSGETFGEFAGALYSFEQVRQEMECIRGRGERHGKASVKRFLYALASMAG